MNYLHDAKLIIAAKAMNNQYSQDNKQQQIPMSQDPNLQHEEMEAALREFR